MLVFQKFETENAEKYCFHISKIFSPALLFNGLVKKWPVRHVEDPQASAPLIWLRWGSLECHCAVWDSAHPSKGFCLPWDGMCCGRWNVQGSRFQRWTLPFSFPFELSYLMTLEKLLLFGSSSSSPALFFGYYEILIYIYTHTHEILPNKVHLENITSWYLLECSGCECIWMWLLDAHYNINVHWNKWRI